MKNRHQQVLSGTAISSVLFLILVAIFPLLVSTGLTVLIKSIVPFRSVGADTEFASISYPAHNSTVTRHYRAIGTIKVSAYPLHLFIVEQNEQGVFPKKTLSGSSEAWEADLYTGVPLNEELHLSVVTVDNIDRDKFHLWFNAGINTGNYPGLKDVPSLQELSTVTIRVTE